MKIIASHEDFTLWAANCPGCEQPLTILDSAPATLKWCGAHWRARGHVYFDRSSIHKCPRCGEELPPLIWNHDDSTPAASSRPLGVLEVDEILAGMGEPPTCLEELERWGIDLKGAA